MHPIASLPHQTSSQQSIENLPPLGTPKFCMQATSLGQDEELHWLALRLVPGLGARNAGKLIERFRTPQAVLRASRTELEAAGVRGPGGARIPRRCALRHTVDPPAKNCA